MLGRSKSAGRMLADPGRLSLLDLHFCKAALQADEPVRGDGIEAGGASMEVSLCAG